MPLPYPNLSPNTDPKLQEYIRLLHSTITSLEAKLNLLTINQKDLLNKLEIVQKSIDSNTT